MDFLKILVTDKAELLKYKNDIFNLFLKCFNRPIDRDLWYWAYMENPNGNPIVSLYFDDKNLAGHYAFIPIKIKYNQTTMNVALSMTTMIEQKYRKFGLFQLQAQDVNLVAKSSFKFVYGFPNKNAIPALRKRIGWVLEENLCVAKLHYDELIKLEINFEKLLCFDTSNKDNLEWRLSKPNQRYIRVADNILKTFDSDFDIVFNSGDLTMLEKDRFYNIILDSKLECSKKNKLFDYVFGYKLFDNSLSGVEFKKDLLMSDVF